MKKQTMFLSVAIVLFLTLPAYGTVTNYFLYENYGGTWYDAEKTLSNDQDNNMCWAAASSNILAWTGWNARFADADKIFSTFQDYWTDQGGLMNYAWSWWLNGTLPNMQNAAQVDVTGGGNYYPDSLFSAYYHEQDSELLAMNAVVDYLRQGYGVTIGVYGVSISHALTVWGYAHEGSTYKGIWVTDSDNSKYSDNPSDVLSYYDIVYLRGKWFLKDFYGSDNIYIGIVQALEQNDTVSAAPLSGTLWFLGSGLLGLLGLRLKNQKK